jgi:hypothetical protein
MTGEKTGGDSTLILVKAALGRSSHTRERPKVDLL